MTVDELTSKLEGLKKRYRNLGDYSITIHKQDKNQLTCSTTVPVDRVEVGFDWTSDQIILEPSITLTTHPDVQHDALVERLSDYSKERTRMMSVASKLSRFVSNEMPEGELKEKMKIILQEFLG